MNRKSSHFIKQGYPEKLVNLLESCGVRKHMLWFLQQITKGNYVVSSKESQNVIVEVNQHLEQLKTSNPFIGIHEAYQAIKKQKEKKDKTIKNTLYKFKDGFSVVKLEHNDLEDDGLAMANCVGSYVNQVRKNHFAILALKDENLKTVAHFQILKNGSLAQNFEKANTDIRYKYWKYIMEFFKSHNKNIAIKKFDKDFDFGWTCGFPDTFAIAATITLPHVVGKEIGHNGEVVEFAKGLDFKRFKMQLDYSGGIRFTRDKECLVSYLQGIQKKFNDSFEDLIKKIKITEGYLLYLSDQMKEKIFGKNNYLLKGNDYKYIDLLLTENGNQDQMGGAPINNRINVVEAIEEPRRLVEEQDFVGVDRVIPLPEPAEQRNDRPFENIPIERRIAIENHPIDAIDGAM